MRTSQYLLATLKETPADAEITSHQLMLRAGMIRRLASGLYTWLPLGLKVLRKVEAIVREEMNAVGAVEIMMPLIQPAELWHETQRWDKYGRELLKIKDRHDRDFCFGPTHEEVITDIARRELKSYKQLPLTLYQIQTKFRDEIRPRFGVMRAREFLMKDAYSFHTDQASLQNMYDKMYAAYSTIFTRLGLEFKAVLADTGSIGGRTSHEFHVLAQTGEDQLVHSDESDYAANVEQAVCLPPEIKRPPAGDNIEKITTPNQHTIEEVCEYLKISPEQTIKTLFVKGADDNIIALVLRGDHQLNEIKAEKLPDIAAPFTFASHDEIKKICGSEPGSVGPVGLTVPVIVDHSAAVIANFVCGANEKGFHLKNVNWGRDLPEPLTADIRKAGEGDLSPDGKGRLQLIRGIEVGHIFQLGTTYSESLDAKVINEDGRPIPLEMGSYGIGVSRIVAAAIEQNNDERGIIWPKPMAPFQIALIPIGMQKSIRVREACENLFNELVTAGFDVLFDDRAERPGVMFADCDLIGIPHRLVLSEKGLDAGTIEYKARTEKDAVELSLSDIVENLRTKMLEQN